MLLANKTAVVTGCNKGIGKAILETLASHGANVWACARQENNEFLAHIEQLAARTGTRIRPVYFDLANLGQVKAAAKIITGNKDWASGAIDILVNNAGIITTAPFVMSTEAKMREMFEVNFLAPVLFSQYITRVMARQRRGSIVNISSSAALDGNEGRSAYASSKGALVTATKVMASELGPANIRVNAIAPGLTETDMMRGSTAPDAMADTLAHTALRRVGQPVEIANVVLFLASDLSSYMTGQVLRVDGGM